MRRVAAFLLLVPSGCLFPTLAGLGGDAGAPGDASGDVSTAPPDGSPDAASEAGFCASLTGTHTFCDDFDEAPYMTGFPNTYTSANSSFGANGAEYTSAPTSLFATINQVTATGDQAYAKHTLTTGSAITFAFDFRVDAWTSGRAAVFAAIILDDGQPDEHQMTVYTTGVFTALEEQIPTPDGGAIYNDDNFTNSVTLGTWARIAVSLDLVAGTVSATLNGATVVDSASIDASWARGPLAITTGFTYLQGEAHGWQARFDNVVVDVTP